MTEMDDPQFALEQRISYLKIQQAEKLTELIIEAKMISLQLKPVNIIRNSINSVLAEPELQIDILKSITVFAVGRLTRKLTNRGSRDSFVQFNSIIFELLSGNYVGERKDKLIYAVGWLLNRFGKQTPKAE